MDNIIVTGASGLVATELIHLLIESSDNYKVYAVSTHPDKLHHRYANQRKVECISLDGLTTLQNVEIRAVIHCAFARSKDAGEIAASIQYTSRLLQIVKHLNPAVFVNISSQSVYGQVTPPLWTEQSPPAPDYLYALGKYATEELTSIALTGTGIKFSNIRLSSVCENARFMNVFAKNALTGVPITVRGGDQTCSFVDVRDVALGLMAVIKKAPSMNTIEPVYNLGSGLTRTVKELAEETKRLVEEMKAIPVEVNITPADIQLKVGMDISLFCSSFDWQPIFNYDDMIKSLIMLNDSDYTGGGAILFQESLYG